MWVVRDLKTLTVLTSDSILATRLRLEQQQIINYFNNHSTFIIDTLQVKMTMPKMTKRQKIRKTYQISERNVKIVSSIAEGIEDDELREGLLRITRKQP